MILVFIQILITVVIGAILFWLIDRFIRDGRLANLLKILVVLVCLASILQRLLPMLGIGFYEPRRNPVPSSRKGHDSLIWSAVVTDLVVVPHGLPPNST